MAIVGETYCRRCVEEGRVARVTPVARVAMGRAASITIAAILFFISGVLELVGSLIIMAGGMFAARIPYFGGLLGGVFGVIGFVILIMAMLDIYAGKLLWDNKKSGGTLGIILAVLGFIIGLFTWAIGIGLLDILLSIILIILIAVGWNTLKD